MLMPPPNDNNVTSLNEAVHGVTSEQGKLLSEWLLCVIVHMGDHMVPGFLRFAITHCVKHCFNHQWWL